MMQSLTFFVLLKKAQALLLFSCVGNWYILQINVDNIINEHIESEYLVCHESRCHFFKAKHVYKQDTNSGALAGGIVSLAIVLLAVAIIIFIYRR